jgi:hypothetical protein
VRVRNAVPLTLALLAGYGGSAAGTSAGTPSKTLDQLWHGPGQQVSMVAGTSDYATGEVRVSFVVVDHSGRQVDRPTAHVWLAPKLSAVPIGETTATLEPVGAPGAVAGAGDVTHLYVAKLRVPRPGTWWVLARPDGAAIGAVGNLVVHARSVSPAIGARAYPSQTPTLASAHGRTGLLTTRTPPDRSLLRYSIADSLKAHAPFVVVFATPKFCTSRTCGPVVDVVLAVQRLEAGHGIRFVHVEIYQGNDPAKGENRWVREWKLPTEPWLFLVGRDGRIKAKFEGSVSARELEAAVRATLR